MMEIKKVQNIKIQNNNKYSMNGILACYTWKKLRKIQQMFWVNYIWHWVYIWINKNKSKTIEILDYEYIESNWSSMLLPFLSQDFGFELTFNLI